MKLEDKIAELETLKNEIAKNAEQIERIIPEVETAKSSEAKSGNAELLALITDMRTSLVKERNQTEKTTAITRASQSNYLSKRKQQIASD